MKKLKKQPQRRSHTSRHSGEVLAEGIQKRRRPFGFFTKMSDKELISYAKKIIEESGIKNRSGLEKADKGMTHILRKRKLLDALFPEKQKQRPHGFFTKMSDKELISYAKKIIKENKIKNRNILAETDSGLCDALRRRNLLYAVIPNKQKQRDWASMSDEELISYVKNYLKENKIKNRRALQKADASLDNVLRKRNLLDLIIPDKMYRDWFSMTDEELASYAKKYIEEKGIKSRRGLVKADGSVYEVLRKRNLLDTVFAGIEQTNRVTQVKAVVDAMKDFDGGSE